MFSVMVFGVLCHPTIGQLGRDKSLALSGTWWSINGSTALARGPQCVNSYWLHCSPLRMPETIIIWFSNYFIDILTTQSLILIDPGTYAVTADSHHFTIPQITWSFGHFSMPTQRWTIYATHTADSSSLTRLRVRVIGCINTKWCFTPPIRKNIDIKKIKFKKINTWAGTLVSCTILLTL